MGTLHEHINYGELHYISLWISKPLAGKKNLNSPKSIL